MFATAMIVYEKSQERVDNYKEIQKIIPELILFPAIDSINHYDKYRDYSLKMNYITTEYINKTTNLKGKIGCNISHIELLKHCMNLKDDWFLILEDDVALLNYKTELIDSLIESANLNNTNYIQLYTNPKFINTQRKATCIKENLYKMIPQWHTSTYLISKKGIDIILSKLPYDNIIDEIYSRYISELNSLCYINTVFLTEGAKSSKDKSSKFGSLLWGIKKNPSIL